MSPYASKSLAGRGTSALVLVVGAAMCVAASRFSGAQAVWWGATALPVATAAVVAFRLPRLQRGAAASVTSLLFLAGLLLASPFALVWLFRALATGHLAN